MNGTKDDCVKQTKPQSKTSYQERHSHDMIAPIVKHDILFGHKLTFSPSHIVCICFTYFLENLKRLKATLVCISLVF